MRKIVYILLALIAAMLVIPVFAQQQPVNIGASANDNTGDNARAAFTKVNANDAELYANVVASVTAGGTDTYAASPDPSLGSLVHGKKLIVTFTNANTGASTFNANGLGPVSIKKFSGGSLVNLVSGDIGAGQQFVVVYDGTNACFQLIGIVGGGGVTDHGALTGLADDDHTQYHNDARGDARYPQLSGTYNNPTWLNQLAWSKITGAPDFLTETDFGNGSGTIYNQTERTYDWDGALNKDANVHAKGFNVKIDSINDYFINSLNSSYHAAKGSYGVDVGIEFDEFMSTIVDPWGYINFNPYEKSWLIGGGAAKIRTDDIAATDPKINIDALKSGIDILDSLGRALLSVNTFKHSTDSNVFKTRYISHIQNTTETGVATYNQKSLEIRERQKTTGTTPASMNSTGHLYNTNSFGVSSLLYITGVTNQDENPVAGLKAANSGLEIAVRDTKMPLAASSYQKNSIITEFYLRNNTPGGGSSGVSSTELPYITFGDDGGENVIPSVTAPNNFSSTVTFFKDLESATKNYVTIKEGGLLELNSLKFNSKPVVNDTIEHLLVYDYATGNAKLRKASSISGGGGWNVIGTTNLTGSVAIISSNPISFVNTDDFLISSTDSVSLVGNVLRFEASDVLLSTTIPNDDTNTRILTTDATTGKVEYRTAASLTGSGFTTEDAQDAVGAMVDASLTYVDGTPLLQRAALTGDVTASAGSNATTVANNAVSLAKMADVATGTLFYRKTAATGDPEVQTLATLKTDLGLTGTNTGDQTITLTSDVTGSGTGSFATTIANNAVTLAKMADVATGTVFYRKTAATGDPEVQTLATLKTDLGLTGTNSGDQTITLTGAVTGTGTGSFATTIATPGTLNVASSNSTATAHTHAITSSNSPGAAASLLATDASGHIGTTGSRIVKGWFTDLQVTNAIAGSITGNAATVTTNANLTGDVTSSGNATTIGADKILESHLKSVNAPTDEYVLTYEATTGDFEWQVGGAGGGITNGAANTELMKSDGTNAVASGLAVPSTANIDLGLSGTTGTQRTIQSVGSSTNIVLTLQAKGNSDVNINAATTGGVLIGNNSANVSLSGANTNLVNTPATEASFSTATMLVRASGGNVTKIAASGGGTTNFLRADGTWAATGGGITPSYNTQTGNYTLVLTDADNKTIEMNVGSANTLTVPLNSSVAFPVGATSITIVQKGAGITTVVATGGVTINSSSGSLASPGQSSVMVLSKRATDEWYLWNGESTASASGSNTQIQYNNSGAFAGATNLKVENGNLRLEGTTIPSTPAAGGINLFSHDNAGRQMPYAFNSGNVAQPLQSSIGFNRIAHWSAAGNSTTITAIGAAALTATGTATAANVATTNTHTYQRGLDYLVTVAATTAVAGWRGAASQWLMGNASGLGGFYCVTRWGAATGVATTTNRGFVGMSTSTSAPTDVEPSTLVNMFGMAWDAADANIQFMYNDGSGTATKTDLGANFVVPTADRTDSYEIVLYCAPNTTTVYYEIKNLATGNVATGNVNTNIPSSTTLLSPRGWMSVGGTSSVIGIKLMNLYIESDL